MENKNKCTQTTFQWKYDVEIIVKTNCLRLYLTSVQGALSSLSTAEQMGRNFSAGTPHISNIASNSFRWFNLIKNFPTGSSERISDATVMT